MSVQVGSVTVPGLSTFFELLWSGVHHSEESDHTAYVRQSVDSWLVHHLCAASLVEQPTQGCDMPATPLTAVATSTAYPKLC